MFSFILTNKVLSVKATLESADLSLLKQTLVDSPELANQPIKLGSGEVHPINFICDCYFENKISKESAFSLTKTIIEYGGNIDGSTDSQKDTPLIAACSLYCDDIAIMLIDKGADLSIKGTHGGTCLHWACWTGAIKVVNRLLQEDLDLEDNNNEFDCTPLLWTIDGLINGQGRNIRQQSAVIIALLEAGANPKATVSPNGKTPLAILEGHKVDKDLIDQFKKYL